MIGEFIVKVLCSSSLYFFTWKTKQLAQHLGQILIIISQDFLEFLGLF
jgi:hypothetical protein